MSREPADECLSEDEVLDLALGKLERGRAGGLLRHIEGCGDCEVLLGEAGRAIAEESEGTREVGTPLHPGTVALFSPGDRVLDRFLIQRQIGSGGMGEVYEAEDSELGERVALKTIRADVAELEQGVERFKQEIRLARRVVHPNVCRVLEFGRHEERGHAFYFLTMELLKGELLSTRLSRVARLSTAEAVRIVCDLSCGLSAIHGEQILHRDVKASNVMLCSRGGQSEDEQAVLLDFGIARPFNDRDSPLTTAGLIGTPDYMSPEQLRGETLAPQSDVYALGVLMFELVTGTFPFQADNPMVRAVLRLDSEAPRLSSRVATVSPALDELTARCLSRDPKARPASAQALFDELAALGADGWASGATSTRTTDVGLGLSGEAASGEVIPVAKFAPRVLLVGAALVLALLIGASQLWSRDAGESPSAAEQTAQLRSDPTATAEIPTRDNASNHQLKESPTEAPESGESAPLPDAEPEELTEPTENAIQVIEPVSKRPARPTRPKRAPLPRVEKPQSKRSEAGGCTPPYFYDEQGVRVYREECL